MKFLSICKREYVGFSSKKHLEARKRRLLVLVCFFIFPFVLKAQNVGIGTVNPTEKLQVSGNIKTDTIKPNAIKLQPNAGEGKILTSDAEGNAAWESSSRLAGNVGYGVWGDCATNGNISEYQPVADSEGESTIQFGRSVSISGAFALVGAPLEDIASNADQGSASFYRFNGTAWVLAFKTSDPAGGASQQFGKAVSISGNYAIVGANGSASIYSFNGSTWVFMQKITDPEAANGSFGTSVSIFGMYAIVGVPLDNVNGIGGHGSAAIFRLVGQSWLFMQRLTDPAGATEDRLGTSVSIFGSIAVCGAPRDDNGINADQGSVCVFRLNGVSWAFMQKIVDPAGFIDHQFGSSLANSTNHIIVGSPQAENGTNENQGAATIFRYNGSNWVLMSRLVNKSVSVQGRFGASVSISNNYALVGAPSDNFGLLTGNYGSATIYQLFNSAWQKFQWIKDPANDVDNGFGFATAIDAGSKRFLIGALGFDPGGKILFGKIN